MSHEEFMGIFDKFYGTMRIDARKLDGTIKGDTQIDKRRIDRFVQAFDEHAKHVNEIKKDKEKLEELKKHMPADDDFSDDAIEYMGNIGEYEGRIEMTEGFLKDFPDSLKKNVFQLHTPSITAEQQMDRWVKAQTLSPNYQKKYWADKRKARLWKIVEPVLKYLALRTTVKALWKINK